MAAPARFDGNAACETKATLHVRLEQGRGRKADEK
jgi:hypothetical protein